MVARVYIHVLWSALMYIKVIKYTQRDYTYTHDTTLDAQPNRHAAAIRESMCEGGRDGDPSQRTWVSSEVYHVSPEPRAVPEEVWLPRGVTPRPPWISPSSLTSSLSSLSQSLSVSWVACPGALQLARLCGPSPCLSRLLEHLLWNWLALT